MKFVWSETARFVHGGGGTENHTIERARELLKQHFSVEIILLSNEPYDPGFSDIPFSFISSAEQLSKIDDTIIYIARGQDVETIRQSYLFLHFPITHSLEPERESFLRASRRSKLITNSKFSQKYWAQTLNVQAEEISIVYPFAHPVFSQTRHQTQSPICRVLYPNRITPEKGLFVFLEAAYLLHDKNYEFIVTGAGNQTAAGKNTEKWLSQVSQITYIPPAATRDEMAALYSSVDIVSVPSRADYWQEPFGMTSVEGQHSGCRVIASKSGGLSETDCGLLSLVEAGNAYELSKHIEKLRKLPPVKKKERVAAGKHFTLLQSVNSFLSAINYVEQNET